MSARKASKTTPFARVEAIVARNANVAVTFRRGPTRFVRMLKWNLRNDRIAGGQWMEARVLRGDVLWSRHGRLFQLPGPTRQGMKLDAEPQLVADLSAMTFEAIEAPKSALKWP